MSEPAHDVKTIENVLNSVAEHPVNYRTNQIPDIQAFRQQAESLVNAYHQSKSPAPAPTPPQPNSFTKSERQLDSARSEERCNLSPENLADRLNSTTHPPPGHFSGESQRNEARYKSPTTTSQSHVQSSQPNLSAEVQERFRISPGPGNNSRHQYPDASRITDKYRSSPASDYTNSKSDERYRNSGIPSPHYPSNSSFSDIPSHIESEGRYGQSPDTPTNLATRDDNEPRTKMDYANNLIPRKFSPADSHQAEEALLNEEMKPRNLTLEKNGSSPDLPKDFTCDRLKNCEDMDTSEPQTFSSYERSEDENNSISTRDPRESFKNESGDEGAYTPPIEQFKTEAEPGNYDIIKNMTEKYGGIGVNNTKGGIVAVKETPDSFETRRNNLENVLSKMSKVEEESSEQNSREEEQMQTNEADPTESEPLPQQQQPIDAEPTENMDTKELKPKLDHKPIKLKIARGEVVANTVLDSVDPDEEVQPKEESGNAQNFVKNEMISSWALDKLSILALHEKIQTDPCLKERVSDIVGDDVLTIFASAVDEAENAPENNIENKNVVFLYYAVKNSTNLDMENFNKNELEPLSNLALSIPLLSNLCKFVLKDQNMKEELHSKIGKEDLEYLEMVTNNSVEEGDEFLQDESITPKIVKLYHATRNIVLFQAFSKLGALYKKIENILTSTETTDDIIYNVSLVRLKTLIAAPWNQQVIAAEAMKYDFDFLGHVYSFWKKVISQRSSKPEKKVKKTTKTKIPTTFDTFGRPKRSRRRRNDVVTYDEDVMQNCVIKSETNIKLEPEDDETVPEGTEEMSVAPFPPSPTSPVRSQGTPDYIMQETNLEDTDQFKLRPLTCKKRKGSCNHVIVDGRDHYDRKTWAALAKLEVDV